MKMIVTGSEGFIGKALCQELKRRDVEVIGIDRKNGKDAASILCLLHNSKLLKQAIPFVAYIINY